MPDYSKSLSAGSMRDLTEDYIEQRIIQRRPVTVAPRTDYRQAAVLVPLFRERDGWHVLFTRRTDNVQDHKGQVSFPGGMAEPEDGSLEKTALRETFEEIGIPAKKIRLVGRLDEFETISGYVITPVCAFIDWPVDIHCNLDEVSRVFSIPLAWLAKPEHHSTRQVSIRPGRLDEVLFFDKYDGELLWGITARIMLRFLEILG